MFFFVHNPYVQRSKAMTATIHHNEFRLFLSAQQEVIDAIKSGDGETVHYTMLEIEELGGDTTCPKLRKAVADFLRLHAKHVPTREAREARNLEGLRLEVEEAIEEAQGALTAYNAMVTRENLSSIEAIWLHTHDKSTREDAAALLRKNAAYAKFRSFIA